MKETINANIGQQAFVLDCDAYDRLNRYFGDVRSKITDDTDEVMNDIEIRVAEILREELPSQMMVVTLAMVERAIARVGAPEDFGAETQTETENFKAETTMETKKLRRSRTNRSIAGVCGGLANYLGLDPTVLRIAMVFLTFFAGMSLWVYIILWLLIPEE